MNRQLFDQWLQAQSLLTPRVTTCCGGQALWRLFQREGRWMQRCRTCGHTQDRLTGQVRTDITQPFHSARARPRSG